MQFPTWGSVSIQGLSPKKFGPMGASLSIDIGKSPPCPGKGGVGEWSISLTRVFSLSLFNTLLVLAHFQEGDMVVIMFVRLQLSNPHDSPVPRLLKDGLVHTVCVCIRVYRQSWCMLYFHIVVCTIFELTCTVNVGLTLMWRW